MSSLNWVDNIILAIFLISILAGLMRGLVREMISLLTWVAAFVVSILFSTKVAGMFSGGSVQNVVNQAAGSAGVNAASSLSMLSIGASFVGLFVATLIVGSVINYLISSAVEGRGINFSNRLLGGVFGLARGFLLVIFVVFLIQLTPLSQQPYWTSSQFVHSFQPVVKWINDLIGPQIESIKNKVNDSIKSANPGQYLQGVTGSAPGQGQ